ncbi:MAG: glycosyltransferase [Actinomycetota bacterium]|nr:glycosyltransferase [Actinomycetota bacterium]
MVDPAHVLVPGNRWDLLPPGPTPSVTVVVVHFEQPVPLERVLAGLARQTHPSLDVVVADDGSATPPSVPPGVRLVRQPDLGFRAAAARNLGAATSTADVLVFLDADTVPDPGFVAALVRHAAACPDVLAVGRRRHTDLAGGGAKLPEPTWLTTGYQASRDLLDADGRSFRFVISAVLACRRALFEDLGGFDERFVGYGGEDWDLAYRAWNAGAVLVHERDAVAWHDGPAWEGRASDRAAKEAETARLAALVPEPRTRGAPLPGTLPDVLVDVAAYDPRCVHALLRSSHRDLQVRVRGAGALHAGAVRTDPWTDDQLRRARVQVRLDVPVAVTPDAVARLVERLTDGGLGELVLRVDGAVVGDARSTRAIGRARRWAGQADDVVGVAFGREDVELTVVPPRQDLAGFLAADWA